MKLSVIVPYLSKSKAFPLFKDILYENTENEFELIEIVNSKDVYGAYNKGALQATGDIIVCINDDMFLEKGWDKEVVKYSAPYRVITFMGVVEKIKSFNHNKSIIMDFGDSPETFKRKEFEEFCLTAKIDTGDKEYGDGTGWLQPMSMLKENWVPYPNKIKYPYSNDITYFYDILPRYNFEFIAVRAFCYHLQNYSKELL